MWHELFVVIDRHSDNTSSGSKILSLKHLENGWQRPLQIVTCLLHCFRKPSKNEKNTLKVYLLFFFLKTKIYSPWITKLFMIGFWAHRVSTPISSPVYLFCSFEILLAWRWVWIKWAFCSLRLVPSPIGDLDNRSSRVQGKVWDTQ